MNPSPSRRERAALPRGSAGARPIPERSPAIRTLGILPAVLCLLALASSPVPGQESAIEERPFWEIGVVGGIMDDHPEFSREGNPRLAHEGLVGGRAAVHLPSRFFLESEVLYSPMEIVTNRDDGTLIEGVESLLVLGSAGYAIPLGSVFDLHLRSGLGAIRWDAASDSEVDFVFNGGAGLRIRIAPTLGLRADGRWHLAPSALATTRRQLTGENARGEMLWLGEVSAGLSVYLGR